MIALLLGLYSAGAASGSTPAPMRRMELRATPRVEIGLEDRLKDELERRPEPHGPGW